MQKHCQLELKKTEAIENEMKALNLQISTISRLRKLLSSKYILCVIKSKGWGRTMGSDGETENHGKVLPKFENLSINIQHLPSRIP